MTEPQDRPAPLTQLEIASGVVVGADPAVAALPHYDGTSPRSALEAALLTGLVGSTCAVSFSGGRDSSAMLALAVHVARREGLPMPLPVTLRYPDAPDTREDEWQQVVIDKLGLTEWHRISITDELDIVGPVAQTALLAHGSFFPFNAHTFAPMLDLVGGGTLVTGLDGDGLLASWPGESTADVLSRRRRPSARDVLRVGLNAGPLSVRRAVIARRMRAAYTWLTPTAEAASRRADASEMASEPLRWDRRVHWWRTRRYLIMTADILARLGAAAGTAVLHPMLDPAFLASIAHAGGRHGPGDRTTVMRSLAGDLLPDAVLRRESKATFDAVFFHDHSARFARSWDGTGVDPQLVDPVRLRAAWTRSPFPLGAALQMQAAWLATSGHAGPNPVDAGPDG